MNTSNAILTGISQALALAAPDRVVTRSYAEFTDRDQETLLRGLWTLLARGAREEDGAAYLDMLLVGQLTVREDASDQPLAVEQAELAMLDEVLCLVSGIRGCALTLRGVRHSMQIEAPDGWLAVDLEAGGFALNEDAPVISFNGG